MHLIVGLGNPGEKYEKTRHNAGFLVLDEFAQKHGFPAFEFDKMVDSLVSRSSLGQEEVVLAKPQTMMNNSGQAIRALLQNSKQITVNNLLVIHDDIDLPLGTARVSHGASSAGHKGVESIIQHVATKDFTRVRIGILPEHGKPSDVEAFVLKPFQKKELPLLREALHGAAGVVLESIAPRGPSTSWC